MDIAGFFNFIILALLVILVSVGLDRLYARIAPFRLFYYALRFPGVVLHEIAHVAGCLVTGAEIKKIVLFSETGGSVTYANPKIPLLGTVIISTAPLFVLPLTLAGLTWIFGTYFGCD
ncbi:MAG: M50 family metallopeptidase, partial [Methanoregula sp.]|nr:M50 family metallopeptidase [Methanoregula sp.]